MGNVLATPEKQEEENEERIAKTGEMNAEWIKDWVSAWLPTNLYPWYYSGVKTDEESKEEKMNSVVKQLQFIFDSKKSPEDIEEDWEIVEEQFEGMDLESSWISVQCSPDNHGGEGEEEGGETVTWYSKASGVFSYVTFVKPSSWSQTNTPLLGSPETTPHITDIRSKLSKQESELQLMRNQLELLQKSLTFSQIGSISSSASWSSYSSSNGMENSSIDEEKKEKEEEKEEENCGNSLPPPPPPPLPGTLPQIKSMGTILLKPKIVVKTRKDIELELESLINDSDLVDVNKPKALANFLRCFPSASEKHSKILEMIVTNYPFLIKRFPLQPKTCFRRFQIWEEHLFTKIEENGPIKPQALRRKKTIEIEKLANSVEIMEEISNIFKFIEAEKKKEIERENAKKFQNLQSSMFGELKGKLNEAAQKEQMKQATEELSIIESEEISL